MHETISKTTRKQAAVHATCVRLFCQTLDAVEIRLVGIPSKAGPQTNKKAFARFASLRETIVCHRSTGESVSRKEKHAKEEADLKLDSFASSFVGTEI